MELPDYNLIFVYIKDPDYILMDTFFRSQTLDIYRKPLENPKTAALNNTEEHIVGEVENIIEP